MSQDGQSIEARPGEPDRAALNVAWFSSREFSEYKAIRNRSWITTGAVLLVGTLIYFLMPALQYQFEEHPALLGLPPVVIACVAYFLSFWLVLIRNRHRRMFTDRYNLGLVTALQQEEERWAVDAMNRSTDFASLWAVTQRRIDVYHGIATAQAEE